MYAITKTKLFTVVKLLHKLMHLYCKKILNIFLSTNFRKHKPFTMLKILNLYSFIYLLLLNDL